MLHQTNHVEIKCDSCDCHVDIPMLANITGQQGSLLTVQYVPNGRWASCESCGSIFPFGYKHEADNPVPVLFHQPPVAV